MRPRVAASRHRNATQVRQVQESILESTPEKQTRCHGAINTETALTSKSPVRRQPDGYAKSYQITACSHTSITLQPERESNSCFRPCSGRRTLTPQDISRNSIPRTDALDHPRATEAQIGASMSRRAPINLTGRKFGRLLVIGPGVRNRYWLCRCICGNQKEIYAYSLSLGYSQSCGCLQKERASGASFKHGFANRTSPTSEYRIYVGMKTRCLNPSGDDVKNYGGRGITICDRWLESFQNFYADMGPRPIGKTLDRINTNGNYEPGNCRWATPKEQGRNKRTNRLLTFRGETMPLSAWEERCGFRRNIIKNRLRHNWSVEKAITTPPRKSPTL